MIEIPVEVEAGWFDTEVEAEPDSQSWWAGWSHSIGIPEAVEGVKIEKAGEVSQGIERVEEAGRFPG